MRRHPFLREESKARLLEAVRKVENSSAAEVVVAVKPWSGRYWYVDQALAAVVAFALLAYMMYSTVAFSWSSIVLGPILTYGIVLSLGPLLRPLRRLLCPGRILDDETRRAAAAFFYDNKLSRTRDRSAVLVYVSLLEGRAWALPDLGIQEKLDEPTWTRLAEGVSNAVRKNGVGAQGAVALAEAIEAMAGPLGRALPRRADDVNELEDVVAS